MSLRTGWIGPLLGLGGALLWGERSAPWLVGAAALGALGEMLAEQISSAERTPLDRAVAFFLVILAVFTLIPFVALGGVLPRQGGASPGAGAAGLALIPIVALLAAAARHALASTAPTAPDRRARTPQRPVDTRRWLPILAALALVPMLGWADFRLPAPFSIDFLYLVPVFAVTWATGGWGGVMVAVVSAEAHGIARGLAHPGELSAALSSLESLLIAGGLAAEALLLAGIQAGLKREKTAARTDLLTGLMNRKAFFERVEAELARAGHGEPVALAYLDLDGFKAVNDLHGHAAGDEVLRIVAGVLSTSLRREDVTARLGGDEFAVLLPATALDGAAYVMERVRLQVEDRMNAFSWAVTCSVGVVAGAASLATAEELVRRGDELMYEVKHGGKNALRQAALV